MSSTAHHEEPHRLQINKNREGQLVMGIMVFEDLVMTVSRADLSVWSPVVLRRPAQRWSTCRFARFPAAFCCWPRKKRLVIG
jgi:hypothetical protein